MTGYAEDGGYFSPSLQDEVFQQVTTVPDSVLLHATQLDSIQVNCLQLWWIILLKNQDSSEFNFIQVRIRMYIVYLSVSDGQSAARTID